MQRSETGLLIPSRVCGKVCSEVKPCYVPLLDEPIQGIVWCPLDNIVCGYALDRLRLMFITQPMHSDVRLIAADKKHLYAVVEKTIVIMSKKGQEVLRHIVPINCPKLLLPFEKALVVIDDQNKIEVFEVETGELIIEIESIENLDITSVVHPITYMNQIVVGGRDGMMKIINLETGETVRDFPPDENFNAEITVLEQSPAVDVLGVGLANGRIQLRNIKVDRILSTFRQDGSITSLSFRTDGIDSLVSGNSEGSIAVWDLNERILIGQKTDLHRGPIVSHFFLLGQAFMITSGNDNRLVKWVLKDENSLPEERNVLEGPSEPVSAISFNGPELLMVASKDGCLRQFHSLRSRNMKRLGVGREVKKSELSGDRFIDVRLNPIMEMMVNNAREAVWDNVICQHERSILVSTWSSRKATQGSHLFYHARFKNNPKYISAYATSIFLSCCGNFAIVGTSTGHLDVFNMQSGKWKQSFSYTKASKKVDTEDDLRAHSAAITGVALDMTNHHLVSGAADGSIHFWSFNPPKLISRMVIPHGVSKFRLDRYNSLLAIALDNGELAVVDILCRRVARQFKNAHLDAKVTALEFSPDGKWLVSSDSNCILKIWDLSSSNLIDVMRCSLPCVDLAFNSTGQYLATCHEGQRAVYLWANKTLFIDGFYPAMYDVKPELPIRHCALPVMSVGDGSAAEGLNDSDEEEFCRVVVIDEEDENIDEVVSLSSLSTKHEVGIVEKAQIDPHLVTLSGLPQNRWANLPNLDLIRQRNKPIEPPKKPTHVPFFLPASETLEGFVFENIAAEEMEKENTIDAEKALMAKRKFAELETPWASSLIKAHENPEELLAVFDALKQMNVSAIDFQIRALVTEAFLPFINMLIVVLEKRKDFELAHSYLATFLNIHREQLWNEAEIEIKEENEEQNMEEHATTRNGNDLTTAMKRMLQVQSETWDDVQKILEANTSLAQWIKCSLV